MNKKPLIEFDDICVAFNSKNKLGTEKIITNSNLKIDDGNSIAIIGPSGIGKTTLLKVIAGLHPLTEGEIIYNFNLDSHGQFSFVSQSNNLLPWLTIFENVSFPLELLKKTRNLAERVKAILSEVDLINHAHKYPREISGGMARRAVLARALVTEPKILLMDEPFTGLDVITRSKLIKLVIELKKKHGFTQVFVEHDLATVANLANECWVLNNHTLEIKQIKITAYSNEEDLSPFSLATLKRIQEILPHL